MANHAPSAPPPKMRPYAWLIAGAGLLLLIGSGIIYFINRALAFEMQLGLGLGGVLLLGAVLLRPDAVRSALTGRSVRYGSNAVILSLAFLGILGLINFIAHKNNREYDLTETGLFTLSEQTLKVLAGLDEPVQVIGFFRANDPALNRARDYLDRYGDQTDRLSFEFHDPNIEPGLAQSLDLSQYGALVFVSGNRRYEVNRIDEQSITSGLIRVTNDHKARTLYFTAGHGEYNIDDGGPEGYNLVKEALERQNYVVEKLDLASVTAMPANAAALILAGANTQLLETEAQLLFDWITAGGKLMILVDPLEPVPLNQALEKYGLAVGNNFVVEDYNHSLVTMGPEGLTPQSIAPLIREYPYHEITGGLNEYQSFFPFARSIAIAPQDNSTHVSALLSTSEGSWAETDLHAHQPEYTEGVDPPGPLHLGAAVEDYENGARLVVFGNAGFITNQNNSPQMANQDLFINAVNWLAEDEELISIRPKRPQNRRLFLTPMQISLTLFTTVALIPLAVFAAGIGIWWKRR